MKKHPITIAGVPEHFNAPWHYAIESGLFQEKELSVNFIDYPTGTGAMCADLNAGVVDMAVVLTEGINADIEKHQQSQIVDTFVESPLLWGIHVASHSPIKTVSELNHKTFAISRLGSGSHTMAAHLAEKLSFTIHFEVVGGINDLIHAVNNNTADVFLWEKFTTKPYVDSGQLKRIGEHPTPWPCFMIAANNRFAQNHSSEIHSLLEVIKTSSRYFMDNKSDLAQYISKKFNLGLSDVEQWIQTVSWTG